MITALIATSTSLLAPAQAIDVPFRVMDHAIIVDSVVNGKPVSCMFDTGYSGSYVLNQSVNVGKVTGTQTLRDFVGEFQAETVKINTLKLGSKSIPAGDRTAVKMGNNNYSLSYGTHCDGIMGLEVLKDSPFQINFQESKFVLLPDSYDINKEEADNVKSFKMRMLPKGNNSIELTVRTKDGGKMYLALDTGNGFYATTHKDILVELGLWKEGVKPQFTKQSWVASGPVDSWDLELKDLSIFNVPVETSVFNIIDLPSSSADHHGTVGFGFLKNFNITVDMKKRMVYLENFTGKVSDPEMGSVGLGAVYDPRSERMRIFNVMPSSPAAKAGIQRGDDLLSINGELLNTVTPQHVEDMLEGEPGTTVQLATSRDGVLMRHEVQRAMLINKAVGSN